jgi:16S rRNA (cytosine967-C5)-methyltransferase
MSLGARRLALNVLQDVHRDGAYASLALDKRLKESQLAAIDKRLAANIVYGTLENRIRIDYALNSLLTKTDVDPLIRDILRLSAYQILFLDKVPESAAVNEGVKLCKEAGMEPLAGFVNGVLRNLSRQKKEITWPNREENEVKYLSIVHSVPEWLVERLIQAYGPEVTENICSYRTEQHFTPVRPNRMAITDEAFDLLLSNKVWKAERGQVPHVWRVGGAVDIGADTDYRKGLFSIQGESSVLAAEAVGVRRGMQVLDACAAPGGKSALMAEIMDGTGRVHAWDIHEHRVALIQAVAKRLHLENLRPMVRDAVQYREELVETFDAVLLDAPCSGLGVMLEKPDVKYRHTQETVAAIVETQKKLLDTCCAYVKKGGVLVYATCSLLPEENSEQIESFLKAHPEFTLAPLPDAIPEKFRSLYSDRGLQLFAHRDGLEGFFIARLIKKGNARG